MVDRKALLAWANKNANNVFDFFSIIISPDVNVRELEPCLQNLVRELKRETIYREMECRQGEDLAGIPGTLIKVHSELTCRLQLRLRLLSVLPRTIVSTILKLCGPSGVSVRARTCRIFRVFAPFGIEECNFGCFAERPTHGDMERHRLSFSWIPTRYPRVKAISFLCESIVTYCTAKGLAQTLPQLSLLERLEIQDGEISVESLCVLVRSLSLCKKIACG